MKRRHFLKVAGISSFALFSGVTTASAQVAPAGARYESGEKAINAKRFAMVIDTREMDLYTIDAVQKACHTWHNVPTAIPAPREVKWIWPDKYKACFPDDPDYYTLPQEIKDRQYPLLCNHCANPSCVRVCPTGATYKMDNGIVTMDYHRCIGCRFCMAACPYGSRSFNFEDPKPQLEEINPTYPARTRGAVEKCTFCVERLEQGLMPACVEASNGAITFGDLEDENSDVRQVLANNFAIRRKPTYGTDPSVYYIV